MTNFAQSLRPAFSEHEIRARREVVMRHLCELMKFGGQDRLKMREVAGPLPDELSEEMKAVLLEADKATKR